MERLTVHVENEIWVECGDKIDITEKGIIDLLKTKLAAYEDAEEQERLIALPCKVGTPCFRIYGCRCGEVYREGHCKAKEKAKLTDVIGKIGYKTYFCKKISNSTFALKDIANFGKTVFLTRVEAEKALEGMG